MLYLVTTNIDVLQSVDAYALIVDSAGIDTAAKWPKLMHDPRNTNNAATDLSEFACP